MNTNASTNDSDNFFVHVVADFFDTAAPGASLWFGGDTGRRKTLRETQAEKDEREHKRSLVWLALGTSIVKDIEKYAPGMILGRPATLPYNDGELYWHLRRARPRGKKRGPAASVEIARDFYAWRAHVLTQEQRDESNALLLLRVLIGAADVPDRGGYHIAAPVYQFIEQHYFVRPLPRPLPRESGPSLWDFQKLVRRCARREELMPTWLMDGLRPPDDVRVAPPRAEKEEVADGTERPRDALDKRSDDARRAGGRARKVRAPEPEPDRRLADEW